MKLFLFFAGTPCDNQPCFNGGLCKAIGDNFTCTCSPGFSGSRCEGKYDLFWYLSIGTVFGTLLKFLHGNFDIHSIDIRQIYWKLTPFFLQWVYATATHAVMVDYVKLREIHTNVPVILDFQETSVMVCIISIYVL